MFQVKTNRSRFHAAISMLGVIYHTAVFDLRKSHTNAIIGLINKMLMSLMMVAVFYVMMSIMGVRVSPIHEADYLIYLMSGIFLFQTTNQTVSAISVAGSPTSPMLLHGPLSTLSNMGASSLKSLYEQSIGIFTILLVYSLTVNPVVIDQPGPALYMFFLCIFNGIATGTVFAGLKPWFPKTAGILTTLFQRANMIFSGKMFVASTLPASMLSMFSWNPLFHIIDQTRGFVFLNYTATATSWQYPLIVACVLLVLGLIGQNYAQKHVSSSRSART